MARNRTRIEINPVQGNARREVAGQDTVFYIDNSVIGLREECDDEDKRPGRNNGLLIVKDKCNVEPLNGVLAPPEGKPGPVRTYVGLRPTLWTTTGSGGLTLPNPPSVNVNAARVIAGSNPSKADVDLGVTIGELRDVPQLFMRVGSSMLRNGANFWLSYNFGWKPFVNDMLDMLDVPPKVDQRVNELRNAAQKGYMRRRVQLGSVKVMQEDIVTIESRVGDAFRCKRIRTSERKQWGTARWVPRTSVSMPSSDKERLQAARRAAYGLTFDAYTAWNLIPWSWLIDYFGTLGDVLEGSRNTVGMKLDDGVCIMTNTIHRQRFTQRRDDFGKVTGGTGSKTTEIKRRQVTAFAMPDFDIQMLNGSQLSNLAALGINRLPKDLILPFDYEMFKAFKRR